jgi:type I restriction enzyme S subunit
MIPTLSDVCEFIVDCLHKTASFQDVGFPMIRTPNIGKGRLIFDGVFRVSEETYEIWTQRAVPEPGDLILAREAPAGNVAVVKEGEKVCLGQRTVHLRPNRDKVDSDYLCYFLLTPAQQGKLLAGETGATAKHINMKDIRRLPLEGLPPLKVQQKVRAIVSAYDDLIENNRRRMTLLEEAARQLYQEWFVRLRFPGHEHTRITDGVPEGWERKTLRAVCHMITDGSHRSPPSIDAGLPMASMKDMEDWRLNLSTCRYITQQDYDSLVRSGCRPNVGDVLVAKDGAKYLKYVMVISEPFEVVLLSSIAILRPNDQILPYVLRFQP